MYLLDTGIVLGFQKSGHLDALTDSARVLPIGLVEEVYDEITDPRGDRHKKAAAEAQTAIDGSRIEVRSIALGSAAAQTMGTLRLGKTSRTADLGEAASIAVAAHDPVLTFVTNDAAASLRALQELRGRTLSFHPFLALVVEAGGLSSERAAHIAKAIQALSDWRATHPHWWERWLDTRSSG
jgi:hypothetical protein